MKTQVKADTQKAAALKKMAAISLHRLQETDREKYPSNTLTDYYDIVHKLLEAHTTSEGTKFKGEGAHQELIDYVAKSKLTEQERVFLQEIREYRNRIQYEGFIVQASYIRTSERQIQAIITKLSKL